MTATPKKSEPLTNNTKENNNKKKRRKKITWFNPPFSRNVATNISKKFFTLLSACFPANNKLHKVINKNTIKLSYSCMSNIKQSIANHNKAILSKEKIKEEQIKLCNCRTRTWCPLQGNCLQKGVVYQTTVTQTNTMREHIYKGITENEFNTRYNQHTSSFRLSYKSSATSPSEHIWKLKGNNTDHTVTWKILEKAQLYSPTTGNNLCTTEKAYIACTHSSLKKRRELFSTCPHRRKHLPSNLKSEEKKAPSGSAPSRSAPSGSAPSGSAPKPTVHQNFGSAPSPPQCTKNARSTYRPPEEDGPKCNMLRQYCRALYVRGQKCNTKSIYISKNVSISLSISVSLTLYLSLSLSLSLSVYIYIYTL